MHADAGNLPDHSVGFAAAAGECQGHNTKAEPHTDKFALALRSLSSSLSNPMPVGTWANVGQGATRRATATEHAAVLSDAAKAIPQRIESMLLLLSGSVDSSISLHGPVVHGYGSQSCKSAAPCGPARYRCDANCRKPSFIPIAGTCSLTQASKWLSQGSVTHFLKQSRNRSRSHIFHTN